MTTVAMLAPAEALAAEADALRWRDGLARSLAAVGLAGPDAERIYLAATCDPAQERLYMTPDEYLETERERAELHRTIDRMQLRLVALEDRLGAVEGALGRGWDR